MEAQWLQAVGGLGLFLFGMAVMTDGLRGLAGDLLHRVLGRFTRSPASGAASGAVVTAVLQSSSATTVAAVGLVGAGLLTFTQALGIVFGANLGTTVTGWLVALLGLKFSIGSITLPLVLLGALMRLFGRGKWVSGGTALAGFALIFTGIGMLQAGMVAFEGQVMPATFPDDTAGGRLLLVLIGIAITLVTQSSSAGVATALTALYTGTISFPQAAALVIGMDLGTTVTAVLATLGGSVDTRRTGYSHVIYNLVTACGALLLLTPYTWAWDRLAPDALAAHAEIALVGFHTLFNLVGVLLIVPVASQFAALVIRLVPGDATGPAHEKLDRLLLREPSVALEAAVRVLEQQAGEVLRQLRGLLQHPDACDHRAQQRLGAGVDATQAFVDEIHLLPEQASDWRRLNAVIHALDHLQRLLDRCEEQPERIRTLARVGVLQPVARRIDELCGQIEGLVEAGQWSAAGEAAGHIEATIHAESETVREVIMGEVASGKVALPTGIAQLEAVRWLQRVSVHVARIIVHLGRIAR